MRRGPRSLRGRDAPVPTPCVPTECYDLLVRKCVDCRLLRRSPPKTAAGASSPAPGTALQPQESVGPGAGEVSLPVPRLLFGAPALLGLVLVLALVLVGLVSWRRRQQRLRGAASSEAPDDGDEAGTTDATASAWPPPGEDPGTTPPGHSVPVPATELGSTELVTTKTAGPEQ
ncbi:tumor necrosis factor receptor superfamily member 13C isoform X3 [Callithrix jacchus]|uniref:tumor necrosis factor receptor superfamily member 13C isoform X3 n=1 Tax=Callithrix jacchus TaxID=9483 RepID=UPI0004EFFE55|nr:tumor necrosis factor receptor superfamily member 13C isoform X3 [Callithrix jacchus]